MKGIKLKPLVDILMTISLLFLMSYELLGSTLHEVIGVIMFVLFIVHHILNRNWSKYLLKGKQTPIRIFQNILVVLVLITFILSMISGVVISRHIFSFLPFNHIGTFSRIHMFSTYWSFILMSLHLGLHFNTLALMIKKNRNFSKVFKAIVTVVLLLIFVYGVYAFFKRDILDYLLLNNQFFILGDKEFLPLYIFDYMTIMLSLSLISSVISSLLRKLNHR